MNYINSAVTAGRNQFNGFVAAYPSKVSLVLASISVLATAELAARVFVDIYTGNALNFSADLGGAILLGALSSRIVPYSAQIGGALFTLYSLVPSPSNYDAYYLSQAISKIACFTWDLIKPILERISILAESFFENILIPTVQLVGRVFALVVPSHPIWWAVTALFLIVVAYRLVTRNSGAPAPAAVG